MRIVIAPDTFKESLSASQVCEAIARGLRRGRSDLVIDAIPLADGGEGTVETLVAATNGTLHEATVTGPLGEPLTARWGVLGGDRATVVLEMAAASGLEQVPSDRRDPTQTTTFGAGELMAAALDHGVAQLIVGIGGSATNDGGVGAAQAVGVRFFDETDQPLIEPLTGGALSAIARIDRTSRDPRIGDVDIRIACDVDNPLCGPRGAAAIYGPQKGATPEQVQQLDRHLAHLADLIERDVGRDVRSIPGAGGAGGLGAGLIAFFDATLQPGVQLVMETLRFDQRIAGADLIVTGEGRLDQQSMMGKVIEGVGRAGQAAGVPVVALVGAIGDGADDAREVLDDYRCITPAGMPIDEALARTAEHLESAAEHLLRNR